AGQGRESNDEERQPAQSSRQGAPAAPFVRVRPTREYRPIASLRPGALPTSLPELQLGKHHLRHAGPQRKREQKYLRSAIFGKPLLATESRAKRLDVKGPTYRSLSEDSGATVHRQQFHR